MEEISNKKPLYSKYITSQEWKDKAEQFLKIYKNQCFHCGWKKHLTVHHLSYENLGRETKDDVIVLCYRCHERQHFHRRTRIEKKASLEIKYNTQITGKRICSVCGYPEGNKGPHLHNFKVRNFQREGRMIAEKTTML